MYLFSNEFSFPDCTFRILCNSLTVYILPSSNDFKCREVKREGWMQTDSSWTLIGWKSGQTTYVPLCDRMEGAWLWTQANWWQKLGLVWRNRKQISKIISDYLYLPFFLFIILCLRSLVPEAGVLKKLSLAGLTRYSWLRFGLASAGYRGLRVHDRPVYTAG